MMRSLLLAGLWVISAWGWAAEAPTAPGAPVLLVLGDSLSAAFGIPRERGWVALLDARLRQEGQPYTVINASVSGETTAGGLTRLPGLLAAHRPRVLVIALGANDGLRALALDQIGGNLSRLIGLGKGAGAKVLLVGVRLPPNYGAAYTQGFQENFAVVAAREQVPLVARILEGVAERRELMQPDGLHPTAEAQGRILENVWAGLREVLGSDR